MLHPFLTTIFVILQVLPLVAYVTGFQSSAIKVIHNHDLYGIQQLSGYNFAHNTKKVVCHQQFVGSDDSKGEEPEVVIQIEDLSPSQIAELIEVSFIQACMQLSQGYVDVLKLFIVSVKSAYQRCANYNGMQDMISMVNECPTNTAGRPLEIEEMQLRTTWIYAVALMLDHIQYKKDSLVTRENVKTEHTVVEVDDTASSVSTTYGPILSSIVDLKNRGDSLKTQEFMNENRHLLPDTLYKDDVQLAIASQTVKVLYYTLTVLEDERLANDTEELSTIARPQIPRGDSIN